MKNEPGAIGRMVGVLFRFRAVLAVLVVAAGAFAVWGSTKVGFQPALRDMFRGEDQQLEVLETVHSEFLTYENDCAVLIESEDLFARETFDAFHRFDDAIRELDGVGRVLSVFDIPVLDDRLKLRKVAPKVGSPQPRYASARDEALAHPLIRGHLLSDDGNAALIYVRVAASHISTPQTRQVLQGIKELGTGIGGTRFSTRLSGTTEIRVQIVGTMRRDQIVCTVAGAVISILISWWLLRRFGAVWIVASGPLVGLVWTLGILGATGFQLDVVTTVLPTLILVIGFTDSVHLALCMREHRSSSTAKDPKSARREAAVAAVRRLRVACGLTSLTTAIGFGSLIFAPIDSIQRFGMSAALGAIATFASVMIVVPLLATTRLGDSLLPRKKKHDPDGSATTPRSSLGMRGLDRLFTTVAKRPRQAAIAGVLLTGVLVAVGAHIRPDSKITETLPRHYESYPTLLRCDELFGGLLEARVLVDWSGAKETPFATIVEILRRVEGTFEKSPLTSYPLSLRGIAASLPEPMRGPEQLETLFRSSVIPFRVRQRFADLNRQQALVGARMRDRFATQNEEHLVEIEAELEQIQKDYPGVTLRLTGTGIVLTRKMTEMIGELGRSLVLAAAVIFIILTISFRSLRLGLVSLIPNFFPIVATAAFIVILDKPLLLASAIVFCVCLGVAVDDTIHFLTRYRQERAAGHDRRDSVHRAFHAVGAALMVTTGVFTAGFASVLLSELSVLRDFGMFACVGILMALVGDLIILPAILLCFAGEDDKPRSIEADQRDSVTV